MKSFEEELILLDDYNLNLLNDFSWHITPQGYIRSNKHVLMHHYVLPKKEGFDVDHINGNKLDNRISNLRYLTRSMNALNRNHKSNSNTKFHGVHKVKKTGKYEASLTLEGKKIYLGTFNTAEEANEIRKQKVMDMAEFIEEFPKVAKHEIRLEQGDFYSKRDVILMLQKCTLDKQRVKEAIEKVILEYLKYQKAHNSIHMIRKFTPMHLMVRLFEELGLEDLKNE